MRKKEVSKDKNAVNSYSLEKARSGAVLDMKRYRVNDENRSSVKRENYPLNIKAVPPANDEVFQATKLNLKAQIFSKINKKTNTKSDNYT